MKSSLKQIRRVGLACVAVGAISVSSQALAAGTAANTQIDNRATVNFQVGGVAQTPIESSPTGNSTAGVGNGANTSFVVDNKIDLVVAEVGAAVTSTGPGQNNVVTTFRIRNDGNNPQGYQLSASNLANGTTVSFSATADGFEMGNLRVFVSADGAATCATPPAGYNAGSDTATAVNTLAADACAYVYIVADTPISATNGQAANVRLNAVTAVAGTNGVTLVAQTGGAESPTVVDVVFADSSTGGQTARDAAAFADDQYLIAAAALSVQKTSTVISDPFNGTTNPKSIPGSVVEYGITLTNTGAQPATVVTITDPIPTNTAFPVVNPYNAGASNVSIQVGAATTFCLAEAGGTDLNTDGCVRTAGGVLTVGAPALSNVATGAGNAVTVRFRVTIN
jgi:uncharacterized repeat protein (TIGR01451 family)